MVTVQFVTPWSIFTPTLFRYLASDYVEAFFAEGSLRLSSFTRFAKHADEQRRDPDEGMAAVIDRTYEGGGQTIAARTNVGENAYVLCGSVRHDPQLMADFGCDSYLRIEDTLAFGQAVARRIAGYVGGAEGLCLYQRTRSIEGDLGYVDVMRTASDGTTTYDQQKLMDAVAALAGHAPLFLKEGTFAHQAEYRLFWFTDGPVPPYLDVKVPEARQFCSEPNERTE